MHVVLAVDRAGIVGEDGETHQGIYDLSFLRHIPNMTILAPCNYDELTKMLKYAILEFDGPIVIRYPRGREILKFQITSEIKYGKGEILKEGSDLTILAVGNMIEVAIKLSELL